MNTHANKTSENKSSPAALGPVANVLSEMQSSGESSTKFVDRRSEVVAQKKLQKFANNSSRAVQLKSLQVIMKNSFQTKQAIQLQSMVHKHAVPQLQHIQKKENNTGLPDNLKKGVENVSGISLDDVKVNYNSDKPAQLNAHAYAQGTDIHVAPGQEQHLPHEAWHVVQQKQGRVQPTMQMKQGIPVNDDAGLEHEADVMGARAMSLSQLSADDTSIQIKQSQRSGVLTALVQRSNWDSASLGEETSAFIDPDKEKETLMQYYNLKYEAEEAYSISEEYDGRESFYDESREFQAGFLPEKDRSLYLKLANWFEMQGGFRESAKLDQKVIFERHHILPRASIRKFHDKLEPKEKQLINANFGHPRDTDDSLKILQSLRSNLFMGPANRLDDPKDKLDLLYTESGDLEPVSKIYFSVFGLMESFEKGGSLDEIIKLLKIAEAEVAEVRINSHDWNWNDRIKNWEKRNKPQ